MRRSYLILRFKNKILKALWLILNNATHCRPSKYIKRTLTSLSSRFFPTRLYIHGLICIPFISICQHFILNIYVTFLLFFLITRLNITSCYTQYINQNYIISKYLDVAFQLTIWQILLPINVARETRLTDSSLRTTNYLRTTKIYVGLSSYRLFSLGNYSVFQVTGFM